MTKNVTSELEKLIIMIWHNFFVFNGISTLEAYLKPKPSLYKNSSGNI